MLRIELKSENFKEAASFLQNFGRKGAVPVSRALNKTAMGLKTVANRSIREIYNIKASEVNRAVKILRSTPNKIAAELTYTGSPISLYRFGASPASPLTRRPRIGASVTVKRGGRKRVPGAFVAEMFGSIGLYRRTGIKRRMTRGRYKGQRREVVERLFGPSVSQMAKNTSTVKELDKEADIRFARNLNAEVNFFMRNL